MLSCKEVPKELPEGSEIVHKRRFRLILPKQQAQIPDNGSGVNNLTHSETIKNSPPKIKVKEEEEECVADNVLRDEDLNLILKCIEKTIKEKSSESTIVVEEEETNVVKRRKKRKSRIQRKKRRKQVFKRQCKWKLISAADIDALFGSCRNKKEKRGIQPIKKRRLQRRVVRRKNLKATRKRKDTTETINTGKETSDLSYGESTSAARARVYEKRPLLSLCTSDKGKHRSMTLRYDHSWSPDAIARSLRTNKADPIITVAFSKIAGLGAFATRPIPRHTPIIEYIGEVCTQAQADEREAYYRTIPRLSSSCYMFRLTEDTIIDATRYGNASRFINHSCTPNCVAWKVRLPEWSEGNGIRSTAVDPLLNATSDEPALTNYPRFKSRPAVVIFAACDIKVGEELCFDYAFIPDNDPNEKLKCYCGAKECRGWMS